MNKDTVEIRITGTFFYFPQRHWLPTSRRLKYKIILDVVFRFIATSTRIEMHSNLRHQRKFNLPDLRENVFYSFNGIGVSLAK